MFVNQPLGVLHLGVLFSSSPSTGPSLGFPKGGAFGVECRGTFFLVLDPMKPEKESQIWTNAPPSPKSPGYGPHNGMAIH